MPVIQINTNGGCHLDAPMVEEVLGDLDLDKLDVVIIENVGNLVCPAEFVVGEDMKVTVLSITEGDDKPLKYPIIFKESKVAILNKVDILPFTNFDMEAAKHDLKCIHPQLEIMETAASKDVGVDNGVILSAVNLRKTRTVKIRRIIMADISVVGIGNIIMQDEGLVLDVQNICRKSLTILICTNY